jgi:hypothetical protein
MSIPTNSDEVITAFKNLYSGYGKAHGKFEIKGPEPLTGKVQGKATTIHTGAPEQAWGDHLAGTRAGLGSIPLLDDGMSAQWAAIDIDVNDIDHTSLEKRVEDLGLPLIICSSKSGGAHCYLFLERPCPARDVVDALSNWSAALGYPGVEIFPKQTKRERDPQTGKPRPGNWINLPYFGGDATERYCVHSGERLSLLAFIKMAEGNRSAEEVLCIRCTSPTFTEQSSSSKSREGRNGFLYSKGCRLRSRGVEGKEIRSLLVNLNQQATSKDHPNFFGGPLQAAEVDQIVSSVLKHEAAEPLQDERDVISELNDKHAVVMVGGKCVIANEQINPTFGHADITFSSQADLIARYANRPVGHGQKRTSAGRAWLAHRDRRQYEGIVFAPGEVVHGHLNLDKGFAVEPEKGDCSRFLEHVLNNICKGDDELSDYLLTWMADSVQNRSRRPGISVVLRGRLGTGKGVLCSQFGSLFGPHFIQVSQASHLTGNFNSHLKDKLIVYADEAFWAGDKKAEGVLKALITEDTIQIEMKGKDVITLRNHIRLLISSNNDWVVPAGNEERRFFVVDVGDARIQDRTYFGAIVDQMSNGGREALLYYLLNYDLAGTTVGSPPRTNALRDQKEHSASPVQNWWFGRLMDGHTTSDGANWKTKIRTDTLYEDYFGFSEKIGVKRRVTNVSFGKELKILSPDFERVRITNGKHRYWAYRIPDLESCRRHFDLRTGSEYDWPTDD